MPRFYTVPFYTVPYQPLTNWFDDTDTSVITQVDWGQTTNAIFTMSNATNVWTNERAITLQSTASTYQAITLGQWDASEIHYAAAERQLLREARRAGAVTPAAAQRMEAEASARMVRATADYEIQRAALQARRTGYAEVIVRARALLDSMLTPEQQAQLQRDHFFVVEAPRTRNRYRIRYGTHGNVRLLDKHGNEIRRYCAQPLDVPTEDSMLAQKLMIETDEDAFLRVANASAA